MHRNTKNFTLIYKNQIFFTKNTHYYIHFQKDFLINQVILLTTNMIFATFLSSIIHGNKYFKIIFENAVEIIFFKNL
jgi:hypothetical protein